MEANKQISFQKFPIILKLVSTVKFKFKKYK